MLDKLKDSLGLRPRQGEDDVTGDDHLAESRATGGAAGDAGDAASTTGTGVSGDFVGRAAGQDDGAERTSGAEARAFGAQDSAVTDDEPSAGSDAEEVDSRQRDLDVANGCATGDRPEPPGVHA